MLDLDCEVKKFAIQSNLKISLYKLKAYSRELALSNYDAINTCFSEFILLKVL